MLVRYLGFQMPVRLAFVPNRPMPDMSSLKSSHRIDALVADIIDTSEGRSRVYQSPLGKAALDCLRSFLFQNLYNQKTVAEEEAKGCHILRELFEYFMAHPEEIPEGIPDAPQKLRVKDYIAGMTDKYAEETYKDLFIPKGFHF